MKQMQMDVRLIYMENMHTAYCECKSSNRTATLTFERVRKGASRIVRFSFDNGTGRRCFYTRSSLDPGSDKPFWASLKTRLKSTSYQTRKCESKFRLIVTELTTAGYNGITYRRWGADNSRAGIKGREQHVNRRRSFLLVWRRKQNPRLFAPTTKIIFSSD